MTNLLVGDVYAKIIEEVVNGSVTAFEEMGVEQDTLQELQRGWQTNMSARAVAQMPWDPKPEPVASAHPTTASNGLPSASYPSYDATSSTAQNGARVKAESGNEHQYHGLPNGYQQQTPQGGMARAQQLVQQQYGAQASASLSAMQRAGGLALPGQQQARPQGLQLPGQSQQAQQQAQQQYSLQQQQAAMQQRQHLQQQQQQQQQPRIKMESSSPQLAQGAFQQPNYTQTDGADDSYAQWQAMLAQRRAVSTEQMQQADHMIRDHIIQSAAQLESGLMLPLSELSSSKRKHTPSACASASRPSASSSKIPQLDGVDEDEDEKPDIKDEEDKDAINSDLDDDDDQGIIGDDDDDEDIDGILCTYDKVQRVKSKWKCTLKDGIMHANGKEWVFHKGTGEFEW